MEMRKTLFCAVAVLAAVPALAGLRGGPVPAIDTAGIHVATYYGGRRASVTFTFDGVRITYDADAGVLKFNDAKIPASGSVTLVSGGHMLTIYVIADAEAVL